MPEIIDKTARLMGPINFGHNVTVGPYCVIGYPYLDEISYHEALMTEDGLSSTQPVFIGNDTALLSHVIIGDGSTLGNNVWCDHFTYIGNMTYIENHVQILYGAKVYHRVKIGEKCWIGGFVCNDSVIEAKSVVLGSLIHKFVEAVEGVPEQAPIIRQGAFVGMNSIIIGGIEVGAGAYVAAGSVLTRTALPGRLYCGSPAKDIGPAPSAFKFNREEI
jgi:UDP-2-acetamido-3-amino-2,3-dideoxy-glucuronate N-acetyltransferase